MQEGRRDVTTFGNSLRQMVLDRFDCTGHEDEVSAIGEILLPIDEISFMVVVFHGGGVSHGSSRQPESDRPGIR